MKRRYSPLIWLTTIEGIKKPNGATPEGGRLQARDCRPFNFISREGNGHV